MSFNIPLFLDSLKIMGLGMIGIPLADTVFYVLMNAALLFMLQRRVGSVASRPLS